MFSNVTVPAVWFSPLTNPSTTSFCATFTDIVPSAVKLFNVIIPLSKYPKLSNPSAVFVFVTCFNTFPVLSVTDISNTESFILLFDIPFAVEPFLESTEITFTLYVFKSPFLIVTFRSYQLLSPFILLFELSLFVILQSTSYVYVTETFSIATYPFGAFVSMNVYFIFLL